MPPGGASGPEIRGGLDFKIAARQSPRVRATLVDALMRHFSIDPRNRADYTHHMPYRWTYSGSRDMAELRLWPHESLPPRGYAAFLLATFAMAAIPLYMLLGTRLLWGLLPFVVLAIGGLWFALDRNHRDAQLLEVLRLESAVVTLTRFNPRGANQHWSCAAYWARPHLHRNEGPVPNYVTLTGGGREVEIGAFLSEDERKALYAELSAQMPPRPPVP